MSSIIEDYSYDVFISYRQKDNRHDGWVSEFVNNLKGELESTFKEEISLYFDINPHDGLLETHDVDASLKEKLKCLIFIPIISRTYCDPKSFAWENEFKAFIEMASNDEFGLKVKLPNGNVGSRVLPVRIHELDGGDIKLCESLLGGVLRGIDFIYKSAGVNRPLRANEDHPHDNLHKTYYRDQINKVANAIKEIIFCLKDDRPEIVQADNVEELIDNPELPPVSPDNFSPEDAPVSRPRKTDNVWLRVRALAGIALILGIAAIWGWLRNLRDNNTSVTYSSVQINSPLIDGYGQSPIFAISPDGRTIASSTPAGIQLKSLSNFSTTLLEGTAGSSYLSFSPDGHSLIFQRLSDLYRIGIWGTPKSLVYSRGSSSGVFWGVDDYIYFSPHLGSEGIWRVSSNGGDAEQLTTVIDSIGESAHSWPQLLPDSKTLLYTSLGPSGGSSDSRIVIQQLKSDERKIIIDKAIGGRYLFNRKIMYANNEGNLFIVPFDPDNLKITGEPETVLSGVNSSIWGGAPFYSVSETGTLIFLPRLVSTLNVLDVADRSGKVISRDSIPARTFELLGHGWFNLSISPSGNQLACTGRTFGNAGDIWLINLVSGDPERISFNLSAEEEFPVWSPDEYAIAYTSAMPGVRRKIFTKYLRSSTASSLIREWPRHLHLSSWSHDGKWLAGTDYSEATGNDCYAISLGSKDYFPIASSQANETNVSFSPDGNWVVYQSDESGRYEIYVLSFPGLESKKQISLNGGDQPRWDRSGKFIYYLSQGYVVAQPIETDNELMVGKPVNLFQASGRNFDVSPDGNKFYMYRRNINNEILYLNLITNWFEELENKK